MEKFEKDGKVAIIISSDYGCGWSTWDPENAERKLFDPRLVTMLLESDGVITLDIVNYVDEAYPNVFNRYRGINGLTVLFVDKGAKFFIDEEDGRESLVTYDEINWMIA